MRSVFVRLSGWLAAGVLATPSFAAAITNGSFTSGFLGWAAKATPTRTGNGTATGGFIIDSRLQGQGADATVAGLTADVTANPPSSPKKPSTAIEELRLSQVVENIEGTVLSFDWGTSFGFNMRGAGKMTWTAYVLVESTHLGVVFQENLVGPSQWNIVRPCGLGFAGDGFVPYGGECFDLADYGFAAGDDVTITFVWRSSATAATSCDFARFQSIFWVDRVALGQNCP